MAKPTIEVLAGQGLASLLGERVLLMCSAFFYCGLLVIVNESFVTLQDCEIVYDTAQGGQRSKTQSQPWFVQRASIESFGAAQ